jgi:hypothetical protein
VLMAEAVELTTLNYQFDRKELNEDDDDESLNRKREGCKIT